MLQTTPIEPLDMIELSKTRYQTLGELNSLFNSIIKGIDTLEKQVKHISLTIQTDREICRLNKQLIADEITYRADMLPDHYLNELKQLLQQ